MTKKITFLITAALMLLTMMATTGRMWGQTRTDVTMKYSGTSTTNMTGNNDAALVGLSATDWSVVGYKGGQSNFPGLNKDGTIRLYASNGNGAYITVESTAGYTISSITINVKSGTPTVLVGSNTVSLANNAYAINSSSFTVANKQSSGQVQINSITISYSTGGTPNVSTPTISPNGGLFVNSQEVAITCSTDGATIYYTTDGNDPTTSSTLYSAPFTINATTTVKAFATKESMTNSSIATATFTKLTQLTIEQARTQATGSVATQGIVTSCAGTTGYIQDATAAICVFGSSLTVGDEIRVLGTLSDYNGLLEITSPQITVLSQGSTVTPELMTVAQAVASTNQGWYIRIENAKVTAIEGQNTTIAQGENTIAVRGISGVEYAVDDFLSLNGNIGYYNVNQIANPQNVVVQQSEDPSISASNVNIDGDATSGQIAYTISNPVSGGQLTAATTAGWLTISAINDNNVQFTCVANTETIARTATVTLTYTYNRATVTKDVTVTQAAHEAPHYTWDLSIASYDEITDPDIVTWSSNYATMTNSSKSGGTSASNYLGGDSNNRTSSRFYSGNTLTITPATGYLINSIVFTATSESYASAFAGSTWTNATATASGKTVTVTATNGTNAIVAAISGTCGFTAVTVYYAINTTPSITITPASISGVPSIGGSGELTITCTNMGDNPELNIQFCDAQGATATYDWISGDINGNTLTGTIQPNTGVARTAYLKVSGTAPGATEPTYSNIVSIAQEAYNDPTATVTSLPFAFDGSKDDIATTDGIVENGLDDGYSTSPKLKFKNQGAHVVLHFNEAPGTLTYDIKGDGFSGGTFTVMTSPDNSTYTALETYTTLGSEIQHESFNSLNEDVRYIKWIYTTKNEGKVALGNISVSSQTPPTPQYGWLLTDLADLTTGDIFVIVGDNGDTYAMSNDKGTSAPTAVKVTVANNALSEEPAANIQWNVSGNATNGYIFYPNGSTTTWLYCINNNNGLKVGDGENNTFILKDSYLYNSGQERYVGIYNSADWRSYTSINNNIANQTFAFYKYVADPSAPSITANNVNIAYDATGGSIAYTINNPVAGGNFQAIPKSGGDRFTIVTIGENTIPFTCPVNTEATEQIATVELTYTYNRATVTKMVTITQAAAPVIYTTIPDIFNAATGTETYVSVTFGNWVVSGVTSDNKTAYVTDNLGNGFIIYTSNNDFAVNDKLSGTVNETPLKLFKGAAEFTNLTASTSGLTVTNDGEITILTDKTIADLGGVNTGAVITLSNLTYDGTNLSDGTNTIKPFTTLYSGTFESGKIYNVTGVYLQYDSTKGILPRSADDIEEVIVVTPTITIEPAMVNAPATETDGSLAITLENIVITEAGGGGFDYIICDAEGEELLDPSSVEEWLALDFPYENNAWSVYYVISANAANTARTAYFKVYGLGDDGTTEALSNIVTINQEAYAATYTVSFSINDTIDNTLTATGNSINLPDSSTLTPEGFSIAGWALASSTTAVPDPYTPTADVTLYALLQLENAPVPSDNYVKVTEELTDWSGEYLIVYEDGKVAFDGSLETLDVSSNTIAVVISNNGIVADATTDASKFTITPSENGYYIKSVSNKYIGINSNANGLTSSDTPLENSISYNDTDNDITIVSSGGAYLRYNSASNQLRFRYYKSSSYTGQQPIQLYKKTSEVPSVFTNIVTATTTTITDIPATTCVVIPNNVILTYNGPSPASATNIVIEEGGQLIHESDVAATVQKNITAYTAKDGDGWYLIATPVETIDKSVVAGTTYDLFLYSEPDAMWYAHWANPGFQTLNRGQGYLYANAADKIINYAGLMKATNANINIDLDYTSTLSDAVRGFNLVGNPFTRNLVLGDMKLGGAILTTYYVTNTDRTALQAITSDAYQIKPGEGFFVQATPASQQLSFNASSKDDIDFRYIKIVAGNENGYDNAYIQMGDCNTLRKMNIANKTEVYVMDGEDDYAAARVEELAGSMPVHFKAIADGEYTITIEAKYTDVYYMHLFDNFTGEDIDLMLEPSYTFHATAEDAENRFLLVFDFNNHLSVNENYTNDVFAYQYGDEIIINGEGELQIFDVMGRMVLNTKVNGVQSFNVPSNGVYILRIIGNGIKTQKIVVK